VAATDSSKNLRQVAKNGVSSHVRSSLGNFSETYVGVTSVVPRDESLRRCIEGAKFTLLSSRKAHVAGLKTGKRREEEKGGHTVGIQ